MTIDQFTKSSSPVTVVVNVANPVAIKLARILLEQGSHLLLVDKLTASKRALLGDLINRDDCLFMDSESTFKNIEKFKKIDYVYYFLSQLTVGSTYPEIYAENMEISKMDHKEFLRESNRIDAYLKLLGSFDAAFTLITSAYVSQFLESIPEANLQMQKYAESLVIESVERSNTNARVVRVGELVGKDADISSPTYLARLTREVLLRNKINVFGDGMQQNYLVHTEDAVYAILKAAFTKDVRGRTYLAAYTHPFTSLSLAYQLLELTVEEKQVIFNEVLPGHENIARLKDMCLSPSATSLGWEPQISLEQAISETMESLSNQLAKPWKKIVNTQAVSTETPVKKEEKKVEKVKVKKKSSNVEVESFLAKLYKFFVAEPTLSLLSINKPAKKKPTPAQIDKRNRMIIALIVTVVVAVVFTPYLHFGVGAFRTYSIVKALKTDVAAMDSSRFTKYSNELPGIIDGMISDYRSVVYLKSIPGVKDFYEKSADLLYGGRSLINSAAVTLKAAAPAVTIAKGLEAVSPNNPAGQVSRDYFSEIEAIMSQESSITQAIQDAKIGNARLQRFDEQIFPSVFQGKVNDVKSLAQTYTTGLQELSRVYDLIPYLLGYKERRTYFFMIQNETEIRSTGGWFTNYALLGIENGQVRQLTVNDVYDFDGKIPGLQVPTDMKKALGVVAIKTALSNWDPEMEGTSKTVTKLLAQGGLYQANDVTITLTFQLVRDLLAVLGPVQVEGLGEVTSNNMYDKVGILHAEFTPGSQDKIKVVSQFMPKLLDAIAAAPADKKEKVIETLMNAVKQRTVMVYSSNPDLRMKLLDYYDTYRTLLPVNHPLAVVDWNWGGNKANKFIKRSMDVVINEDTERATMTMLYTNDSQTEVYPEGKYVNIQRVYFPQEFGYINSTGYESLPLLYKTDRDLPYILSKVVVDKQQTKPVTLEFAIKDIPKQLAIYKQSGWDTEIIRVIITRATASKISEQVLKEQGYSQLDGKWVKTYVRKEDLTIRLTE